MITAVTFLWRAPRVARAYDYEYGPEHVNRMRLMLARHLALPHELVCVTDIPQGLHQDIRVVPLDRSLIGTPRARFPKLMLWRPDAAEVFGGERLFAIDLDSVIVRDLTPVVDRPEPVVLWRNSSFGKPGRSRYNGSFYLLDAGVRPDIWEEFTPERAAARSTMSHEQGWVSHLIGDDVATWGCNDADGLWKARDMRAGTLPDAARAVTFAGRHDPSLSETRKKWPWVEEHWR